MQAAFQHSGHKVSLEKSAFLEQLATLGGGRRGSGLRLLAAAAAFWLIAGVAVAQPPRSSPRKPSPAEIKRLDTQLNDAYGVFMNQTVDLITSYENLGQFDRAKVIVEALAKHDRSPSHRALLDRARDRRVEQLGYVPKVYRCRLCWSIDHNRAACPRRP